MTVLCSRRRKGFIRGSSICLPLSDLEVQRHPGQERSGPPGVALVVSGTAWQDPAMSRRPVSLFRRIERALETIASGSTPLETVTRTAQYLVDYFSCELGIPGGRIYVLDDEHYELVTTFGKVARAPIGLRIERTYRPFEELLESGSRLMERSHPDLDQRLESELGTRDRFAAIAAADGKYVLSFDLEAPQLKRAEVISTLNIIRLAVNQKLREERMLEILEEARQIQSSILPRRLPQPGDFQVAARTVPAEIVGGDFYDVISFADGVFYVVVSDATGHGLPAALQVRDVFTGLRMGLAREFKISRTLERLNNIIHRSRLATKFVSLFLAEIDLQGSVIYCNAGHPPALLVSARGEVTRLTTGGMLLGPMADSRYTIGLARLEPGDLLVLYSDGITEANDAAGQEELGEDGLRKLLLECRRQHPRRIVARVFDALGRFTGPAPRKDDQTLVVVKRRSRAAKEE